MIQDEGKESLTPQVSKYPLDTDIKARTMEVFYQTLADLRNPKEVEKFLNDLLTSTELIMVSKRLAIGILLTKEYDYRAISWILKVSTATVGKIAVWSKTSEGKYFKKVVERILARERLEEFWENVTNVYKQLMPRAVYDPRKGPWRRPSYEKRRRII